MTAKALVIHPEAPHFGEWGNVLDVEAEFVVVQFGATVPEVFGPGELAMEDDQ